MKIRVSLPFVGKVKLSNASFIENAIWSLIIRVLSVGLSFLSVSISLDYLGNKSYGIWVTLSSLLVWINFFDFGLANSLQSQLAQAVANEKHNYACELISTSYAIMLRYIVPVLVLFVLAISVILKYFTFLNISLSVGNSLIWAVSILGVCTTIQLTLKPVSTILFAHQKTRLNELITFVIQLLMVALIIVLRFKSYDTIDPFLAVVIINALLPVLIWSLVSIYIYKKLYPELSPSIKYVKWDQTRGLLQTGFQFTILQLYGIVLFFTDNVLIAYLFGANSVTEYSIINKYFSILTLLFGMVLMPYWSSIAVTYAKNDITGTIDLMRMVSVIFSVLAISSIIQFLLRDYIINYWTGLQFLNSFYVSFWVLCGTLLAMFNNIFTILLNSAGKLKLQVVIALFIIILNPTLSIVAVRIFHHNIEIIPIINFLCLFVFGLIATIQAVKVLNNRAVGIWNK